ncbi:MAG: permease prefix domain 1-containing protein, partial [Gemmatimonadaceae bacterium]
MSDPPRWRRYLRFWRSDVRADVDDELLFHIEMRERDLVAAGMPPLDARAEAVRQFGALTSIRDACVTIEERRSRRAARGEVMEQMRLDAKFAVRTLARNPAFAATSVLCIALGVAVTTTIFSWVHSILLRPLPYERSEELVSVYGRLKARGVNRSNISY